MTHTSNIHVAVVIPTNLKMIYITLMDKCDYNIIFKTGLEIKETVWQIYNKNSRKINLFSLRNYKMHFKFLFYSEFQQIISKKVLNYMIGSKIKF